MLSIFNLFKKSKPESKPTRSYRSDGPEKLYIKLCALDQGKGAWAGNMYLAKEFSVTDRTIRRWLETLKETGRINVSGRGKGRRIKVNYGELIKPQSSFIRKGESDISKGKQCPVNVQQMSGKCPTNVRTYRDMSNEHLDKEFKPKSLWPNYHEEAWKEWEKERKFR